jgi:erythronate-4-phosphate dehydrogenase
MTTLVIDDHIPFIKGVFEPFARVIYAKNGVISHKLAMQADGLITRTRTSCNASLLDGTPVRFIATATIGFDHIDTEYCAKQGIQWFHAPGCNANSVKQYLASVLAKLHVNQHLILKGKKIGIIGAGHVGHKIIQLAEILEMVPLVNDPPRQRIEGTGNFVSLDEIRETCDIITFHVPLNKEGIDKTFHLADQGFFENLKKKPVVINTSRGSVVETNAIKDALLKGRISHFIADVWENEPDLNPDLLEMSLIGTPHIAGYSVEGKANGTAACVRAASTFFGFSGLENWFPPNLPALRVSEYELDALELISERVISLAILASYNISLDDLILRNHPEQFEKFRNNYPVRREFEAYTLHLKNAGDEVKKSLSKLGFVIKSI